MMTREQIEALQAAWQTLGSAEQRLRWSLVDFFAMRRDERQAAGDSSWIFSGDGDILEYPENIRVVGVDETGVELCGNGQQVHLPWQWLIDPEAVRAQFATEVAEACTAAAAAHQAQERAELAVLLAKYGMPEGVSR